MAGSSTVVVATHGHCFDGMASAVAFTQLYRALRSPGAPEPRFVYRTCDYGPGDSSVPLAWLDGEDNAILDYRYTAAPTLTWYFDHHGTAFRTPEDRELFDAGLPLRRFYEPTYPSCTQLIADVARREFGVPLDGLADLVRWADMIDSARFPSAEMAVARAEPELQLMTVIEHHGNDDLLAALVPRLLVEPVGEVARSAEIQKQFAPLDRKRRKLIERLKLKARDQGLVVFCDLSDEPVEVPEKFGLYSLYPRASYSVTLSCGAKKGKLSIGYNPWSGAERAHNIGEICRRHGGGGHPVVGAINFLTSEIEQARALALAIVAELET
jgi:hypothetical protein